MAIPVDDEPIPRTADGEHRCLGCGFAAIGATAPPACPMCRAQAWRWAPRRRRRDTALALDGEPRSEHAASRSPSR